MKIITLVENTADDKSLKPKRGLSIYIETPKHKVLFDLGPKDTFIHCTGHSTFESVRNNMGDKVKRISTGEIIMIME